MNITVAATEIDAPVEIGSTEVSAPLSLESIEVDAPVALTPVNIEAPLSLSPVSITAPITIGGAGGSSAEYYTAAVSLAGHRAVALNDDGLLIYADASQGIRASGVIRDAVAEGEAVRVYHIGRVTGFSALSVGVSYWLRENGQLSSTPPSSGILQQVGVPASATTFLVEVSEPTQLS